MNSLHRLRTARLIAQTSNDVPVLRGFRRTLLAKLLQAPGLRVSTGVRLDRSHAALGGELRLGNDVELGPRVVLDISGGITICDGVTLSNDALILSHDHTVASAAKSWREQDILARPILIEDGAWVGSKAIVLGSARVVGRGAIVAAGSVVTKPVPEYSIVAGVPARKIGERH